MSTENLIDNATARPWFDLLDKLRLHGIGEDFPIPQIAVIGDQSSGKSSLLEALSGIPFPRGTGLVTRCPTCISMHKTAEKKWSADISIQKSSFSRVKDGQILDGVGRVDSPADLAARISLLTDQLVKDAIFSSDTIHVRIESFLVPDLTIVDLPGIIRTTTSGQNKVVISEVNNLLDYYIQQHRTIILAVIPANQDIATIDVLERAQIVDPMGSRTIGVLTKLDLVDRGGEQETMAVINNIRKPLALGYVMVKNRNQLNLKKNLSLEQALSDEEEFFSTHEVWKDVPNTLKSIKSLRKKLTNILLYKIQESLPYMLYELIQRKDAIEKEIKSFGDDIPVDEISRRAYCLNILSRFGLLFRQICVGDYQDKQTFADPSLYIKYLVMGIQKNLASSLAAKQPDFENPAYEDLLSRRIQEMRGRLLPCFLSTNILFSLISNDIEAWRADIEAAIQHTYEVFTQAAMTLITLLAGQLPKLCQAVLRVVGEVLFEQSVEISRRMDEMFFEGGVGEMSLADIRELSECIHKLRCERFDKELIQAIELLVDSSMPDSELMKESFVEKLGNRYMTLHGIGYGAYMQIDDARTILRAYWSRSESRLVEGASAALDTILLVKGSEQIEAILLERFNTDEGQQLQHHSFEIESSTTLDAHMITDIKAKVADLNDSAMMCEDLEIVEKRNNLKSKKAALDDAIDSIMAISPKCSPIPMNSVM